MLKTFGRKESRTQDRRIPLSRGGRDDIKNMVWACHSCNSRKRNRTFEEFMFWREKRAA